MAIRFDAIGDYLERPTITPPFSICGWAYMVNDRDDYSTIFAVDQQTVGAGTGRSISLQTDADGVTLGLWDGAAYVGSRTLTPSQWFFWAVVFSSNTSAVWYHANLGDLSLYVSPTATTTNASNQYHHISNNAYSEWFDGRGAYLKHWSVAKTEAQLTSEMLTIRPQSLSSVYLFTPTFPGSGIRARDYSGNGRNWTEGGTLTDEDPPPISWGAMAYLISKVATGGTGYTQSVSGGVTSAGVVNRQGNKMVAGAVVGVGALIRQAQKLFGGTVTSAGTVNKQTNKPLAGTLPSAGVLMRNILKTLAGTLTSTGTLTSVRTILKTLDGTLTSAGSLFRQTNKAVEGSLPTAGSLLRSTLKNLVGTLTSSGGLTTIRTYLVSLAGLLSSSGALTRRTDKPMSGSVNPSGSLLRNIFKSLPGTLSPSGALTSLRAFFVTLTGSLAASGALIRQTEKNQAGTVSPAGTLFRNIFKSLAGALAPDGILTSVRTYLLSLFGTLSSAGALLRQGQKTTSGTLGSSGALTRLIGKLAAGIMPLSGAVAKATHKIFTGVISLVGTIIGVFAGAGVIRLYVTVSAVAVYAVTLSDSQVYVLSLSESQFYTVSLSDALP